MREYWGFLAADWVNGEMVVDDKDRGYLYLLMVKNRKYFDC